MTAPPSYPHVHVDVSEEQAELVALELFELGASGLERRDQTTLAEPVRGEGVTLVASFDDESAALRAHETLGARYAARLERVCGRAWADAWKAYFKPTKLGERLWITPSWTAAPAQPDELVLTIDPENAFGSGIHETTRLVLREVDRLVKGGESVLDVGCGSGILSIAAVLLGAACAEAIDIDSDAVEVTSRNAERNGVAGRVSTSMETLAGLPEAHALVLANIRADVLIGMARPLQSRVALGGHLVLSGVLRAQEAEVRAAFSELALERTAHEGEWMSLTFRSELT